MFNNKKIMFDKIEEVCEGILEDESLENDKIYIPKCDNCKSANITPIKEECRFIPSLYYEEPDMVTIVDFKCNDCGHISSECF